MAVNLAGTYYTDPSIYSAERRRIFERTWQPLCSSRSLAQSGQYFATDLAGHAVIVVRGDDGRIRAVRNVCRHRGSRLVEPGAGQCQRLECPYHSWRYSTTGDLIDTPWFGEESPFKRDELSLAALEVTEWRGLVFVALNPAASLEKQLGDLPAALAAIPLESYSEVAFERLTAPINWKAYIDQFVEYYHVPSVHAPDKAVGIERYSAEPGNRMMCMRAADGSALHGGRWLWSWPNWTLSVFPGGMKVSRANPVGASQVDVYFHYFFADLSPASEPARCQVMDLTRTIFAEDARACERVQTNYASEDYRPGPLHPRHERALAYFQALIREALGE